MVKVSRSSTCSSSSKDPEAASHDHKTAEKEIEEDIFADVFQSMKKENHDTFNDTAQLREEALRTYISETLGMDCD